MTEQELRNEEAAKEVPPPLSFFKSIPTMKRPRAPGASVGLDSLLGVVEAAALLEKDDRKPAIKLRFDTGDAPHLIVQASTDQIWSAMVLEATKTTDQGFQALLPLEQTRNILRLLRAGSDTKVVVGVKETGVCIGPYSVGFAGRVSDFPADPVVFEWDGRAQVPAFYLDEIANRVLTKDSKHVILEMGAREVDGEVRPVCTVVSTGPYRAHALEMTQLRFEVRKSAGGYLPGKIVVEAGLFRHLQAIGVRRHYDGAGGRQWMGMEFASSQLVVRAEDFFVVAATIANGAERPWTERFPVIEGHWSVDQEEVETVLAGATAETIRIRIDAIRETMHIGHCDNSYSQFVSAKRFGGPSIVDVRVNRGLLLDSIRACKCGMIRMKFSHTMGEQRRTPIVVRGEDEQFKAAITPEEY